MRVNCSWRSVQNWKRFECQNVTDYRHWTISPTVFNRLFGRSRRPQSGGLTARTRPRSLAKVRPVDQLATSTLQALPALDNSIQWDSCSVCKWTIWPNRFDLFIFTTCSSEWIQRPRTLRLISEVLRKFSNHILPLLPKQRGSNTGSLLSYALYGHTSDSCGSTDLIFAVLAWPLVETTYAPNRWMLIGLSVCVQSVHPIHSHQIKPIYLVHFFPFKNKVQLQADPVVQQHPTLQRGKKLLKCIQVIVCNRRKPAT